MLTGYPSIDRVHLEGIPEEKLHPQIVAASLFGAFESINATTLDNGEILIERAGKSLTKREFEREVLVVSAGLLDLGFTAKETVVMYTPNLIESMVLTFAANAIGLKLAYANNYRPLDHAIETINAHGAEILLVANLPEDKLGFIFDRCESLKLVVDLMSEVKSADETRRLTYDGLKSKAVSLMTPEGQERVRATIMVQMSSKEEVIFLQTSGSTANTPKILPATNRNIIAALTYMTNGTNQTTNDQILKKGLCVFPFNHPYGWMMIVANLIGGNHVELVTAEMYDNPGEWYKTGANFIYGTPQVLRELIATTPDSADLSPLKAFFSAGLKTDEELFELSEKFFSAHNSAAEVRNNYGIGETLCIGTTSDGVPHRPGACGKVYPGLELVVVDENMNEVKYDEPGEILVWSESMVTHYFGNEEETKNSFIPFRGKTFFRSGDLGSLSRDNYLTLIGRKKRFYQPKGANDKVNCETIETALKKIELIRENAVTICRLADGSEAGAAFVVLKDGVAPNDKTREEIFAHLKNLLREFELPAKLIFVAEIPYLPSGKIDYPNLTQIANLMV